MTAKQDMVNATIEVLNAIVDAIRAGSHAGVSGGMLYAALMGSGCTLGQFERMMSILVEAGRVEKRGDLYFAK